jgi:hypothetical protein
LSDVYEWAVIFTGCGFESDFSEGVPVVKLFFGEFAEPAVGVAHLDGVKSIFGSAFEKTCVVIHEPDDQFALRADRRVEGCVLEVPWLVCFWVDEEEVDVWIFFATGIEFAGAL